MPAQKLPTPKPFSLNLRAAIQYILGKPFHKVEPEELRDIGPAHLAELGIDVRARTLSGLRKRHTQRLESGGYQDIISIEKQLGKSWLDINPVELFPGTVTGIPNPRLSRLREQRINEKSWKPPKKPK